MIVNDYWIKIQSLIDSNRWIEQSQAKFDILQRLFQNLKIFPKTILLTSFNPVVLLLEQNFDCIVVADQGLKYSWQSSSKFVDKISDVKVKVDLTLALDEYFTFAHSEQEQRQLLDEIKKITDGYLITSLQDYKNNAIHKRNHVDAQLINDTVILQKNIIDKNNRQNWQTNIYFIENQSDLTVIGSCDRRTMYFKQLAKYSADIGGTNYIVQNNMLYRGFFSKSYEHIITVQF